MTETEITVPALYAQHASPRMSERYQFYSTQELIEPLLAERWEITSAIQVKGHHKHNSEYAKHMVRITHPSLKLGEDRIEAIISNSHNGRSKLDMTLGAWRFVCSNGIMVGTSLDAFTIPHTQAFEIVQARAEQIIERAPEVAEVFDAWKARNTDEDERHALAIAAAYVRWPHREEPPVDPRELLAVRRSEDRGNDLWTVFQRLQENVMRGGAPTLQNARRHVRGIRAIDETIRVNRGLWQVAAALYGADSDIVLPA